MKKLLLSLALLPLLIQAQSDQIENSEVINK